MAECVFIFNHTILRREEDDLRDAIFFFYPVSTPETYQCLIAGQFMGITGFLRRTLMLQPLLFELEDGQSFCCIHTPNQDYTFAVGVKYPFVKKQLMTITRSIYKALIFSQGCLDRIFSGQTKYSPTAESFLLPPVALLVAKYFCGSDKFKATFQHHTLPRLALASSDRILVDALCDRCLKINSVVGVVVFRKNCLLVSTLPPQISTYALFTKLGQIRLSRTVYKSDNICISEVFLDLEDVATLSPFSRLEKNLFSAQLQSLFSRDSIPSTGGVISSNSSTCNCVPDLSELCRRALRAENNSMFNTFYLFQQTYNYDLIVKVLIDVTTRTFCRSCFLQSVSDVFSESNLDLLQSLGLICPEPPVSNLKLVLHGLLQLSQPQDILDFSELRTSVPPLKTIPDSSRNGSNSSSDIAGLSLSMFTECVASPFIKRLSLYFNSRHLLSCYRMGSQLSLCLKPPAGTELDSEGFVMHRNKKLVRRFTALSRPDSGDDYKTKRTSAPLPTSRLRRSSSIASWFSFKKK